MALSDYYENKILDHMLRGEAFTPPATIYLALFTSDAGLETNAPTGEVSGGGYVRQAVTLTAASSGSVSNSVDIEFPEATASWGTITHAAIVDHATNTNWGVDVNVLVWGALTNAKSIDQGDIVRFKAGDITFSID